MTLCNALSWGGVGVALGNFPREGTERRCKGRDPENVQMSEVGANTALEASEHSLPPGTAPASFQALSRFPLPGASQRP